MNIKQDVTVYNFMKKTQNMTAYCFCCENDTRYDRISLFYEQSSKITQYMVSRKTLDISLSFSLVFVLLESLFSEVSQVREMLVNVFQNILYGDPLAAEYLLLHLLSTV